MRQPPACARKTITALALTTATAMAMAVVVVGTGVARAADASALDQLGDCTGTTDAPLRLALTDDVDEPTTRVTVGCSAVLDLAGHDAAVHDVVVQPGVTFTITDSTPAVVGDDPDRDAGSLVADASDVSHSAGIRNAGATLITSGTARVVARAGYSLGAGIGGAVDGWDGGPYDADGGDVATYDYSTIEARGSASAGIGSAGGAWSGRLTLHDSSTVRASSLESGAGVGGGSPDGGPEGHGGTVVALDRSTLLATGGRAAAGIGGGQYGAGGQFSARDASTVVATGGNGAAGIGGGWQGAGGVTDIRTTGRVVATGGARAPGVGAGNGGTAPGTTTVFAASTLYAVGQRAVSAVGFADGTGQHHSSGAGPYLTVAGNLEVAGDLVVTDTHQSDHGPDVVVAPGGLIAADGDPTAPSAVYGDGLLRNDGTVTLQTDGTTRVSHRHFRLYMEADGGEFRQAPPESVTVLAASASAGGRVLPDQRPTRSGYYFTGYRTQPDGGGEPFRDTTDLTDVAAAQGAPPSSEPAGRATDLSVWASWSPLLAQAVHFVSAPPVHALVGERYAPVLTGGSSGNPVTLSADNAPTEVCTLAPDATTVVFEQAGTCVLYAHQTGDETHADATAADQSIVVQERPQPGVDVEGRATEGERLVARPSWGYGYRTVYQWFADGRAIPGSRGRSPSLILGPDEVGRRLRVRVTGTATDRPDLVLTAVGPTTEPVRENHGYLVAEPTRTRGQVALLGRGPGNSRRFEVTVHRPGSTHEEVHRGRVGPDGLMRLRVATGATCGAVGIHLLMQDRMGRRTFATLVKLPQPGCPTVDAHA